ncbi:hypothetical protein [Nafulsella turpanensis]|uniref:hypothetical protein n=1 Tax=Nafulsella turpanensis TaxID=1265690 RepID=UPI00034C352D|nr:hypothetical protein [Nafulsella turpanensis]
MFIPVSVNRLNVQQPEPMLLPLFVQEFSYKLGDISFELQPIATTFSIFSKINPSQVIKAASQ